MMAFLMFLLLSVMLIEVNGHVENSVIAVHQKTFQDVIVTGFELFLVDSIPTPTLCASVCLNKGGCVSFFYHEGEKWCQGHSVLFTNSSGSSSNPGSKYYYVYEDWCSSEGYVNHRGLELCYKLYQYDEAIPGTTTDYHGESKHYCEERNETLLTHLTQTQLTSVVNQFTELNNLKAFIDGSDAGIEGTWRYSNGDVMTVLSWGPGEPENDYPDEDFVNLRLFNNGEIAMSDSGNHKQDFICQKTK